MKLYKKQAISYEEAFSKEMIGKIVIVKFQFHALEDMSKKVVFAWVSTDRYLHPITLFINSHERIMDQLCEHIEKQVYLRGQIYYDDFYSCISFRPIKNIPFFLGAEE
jgi:hypothetical protein